MKSNGSVATIKTAIWSQIKDGALESEAGMADWSLNDLQRELIAAYAQEHGGSCWLGNVNLYDGNRVCMWQWDGGTVCNFEARFVIPAYDAELERLILEREDVPYTGTAQDSVMVNAIFARLDELKAVTLCWN